VHQSYRIARNAACGGRERANSEPCPGEHIPTRTHIWHPQVGGKGRPALLQ